MKAQLRNLSFAALFSTLIAAGCQPASAPSAASNPSGTYTLTSVDGKAVPCDVEHERATVVIKSGSLKFGPDQRCTSYSVFSVKAGPEIKREVQAVYTQNGAELVLQWKGAGRTKGLITSNGFIMTNEGMVFAYNK